MTDEVGEKIVAISFRTTLAVSGFVLRNIKRAYMGMKNTKSRPKTGKQTVKSLVSQGQGATAVEINSKQIPYFNQALRKYKVDYSIHKDASVYPPKYVMFFKAKDTDVIAQAFREIIAKNELAEKAKLKNQKSAIRRFSATAQNLRERAEAKASDRSEDRIGFSTEYSEEGKDGLSPQYSGEDRDGFSPEYGSEDRTESTSEYTAENRTGIGMEGRYTENFSTTFSGSAADRNPEEDAYLPGNDFYRKTPQALQSQNSFVEYDPHARREKLTAYNFLDVDPTIARNQAENPNGKDFKAHLAELQKRAIENNRMRKQNQSLNYDLVRNSGKPLVVGTENLNTGIGKKVVR